MKKSVQKLHFFLGACFILSLSSLTSVIAKPDTPVIAFHPVPLSSAVNTENHMWPDLAFSAKKDAYSYTNDTALESLNTSIEQYRENIREIEYREGPFNAMLSQQFESVGDLLHKTSDFDGAIDAYEKSLHIIRVNEGLYDEKQFSVLDKLIQSYLTVKNIDKAHELQQSILHLKKRAYSSDDSKYIESILNWADWNISLLMRADTTSYATNQSNQINQLSLNQNLVIAQESYIEAIELIRSSEDYSAKDQLIHAEKKLAAINYLANNQLSFTSQSELSSFSQENIQQDNRQEMAYFFNGSSALKRAIAYSLESPAPDYLFIAEQIMALGDWYLLFDRRAAALAVYEDAFEVLDAVQAGEDDIKQVMTPGMPVMAPGMLGSNLTGSQNQYAGYIDVEFSVSKFGIASRPAVIGASNMDDSPISKTLINKIRREKFRPSFIDGSASSTENVKLRYYYSYN